MEFASQVVVDQEAHRANAQPAFPALVRPVSAVPTDFARSLTGNHVADQSEVARPASGQLDLNAYVDRLVADRLASLATKQATSLVTVCGKCLHTCSCGKPMVCTCPTCG